MRQSFWNYFRKYTVIKSEDHCPQSWTSSPLILPQLTHDNHFHLPQVLLCSIHSLPFLPPFPTSKLPAARIKGQLSHAVIQGTPWSGTPSFPLLHTAHIQRPTSHHNSHNSPVLCAYYICPISALLPSSQFKFTYLQTPSRKCFLFFLFFFRVKQPS